MVSPSGCISPDSEYYLQAAHNLSIGKGHYITFEGKETFNAIWPMGYPLAIAGLHLLTGLSLFWSAKLVNLLCLLCCFWGCWRLFGAKAWFVALPLCTGSMIKIWSYTWSEGLFLSLLLLFCWLLGQLWASFQDRNSLDLSSNRPKSTHKSQWLHFGGLIACGLGMFVVRYVGIFELIVFSVLIIKGFRERKPALSWRLLASLVIIFVLMLLYFWMNFQHTGTLAGPVRNPDSSANNDFGWMVLKGLINEVLVVRDWDFQHLDLVFLGGFIFQIFVGWKIWKAFLDTKNTIFSGVIFEKILIFNAFSYAIVLIILRWFTPFTDLDYRYFAPMTLPLWMAFTVWLVRAEQQAVFVKVRWYVVALFLCSMVDAFIPGSITFAKGVQLFQEKIF